MSFQGLRAVLFLFLSPPVLPLLLRGGRMICSLIALPNCFSYVGVSHAALPRLFCIMQCDCRSRLWGSLAADPGTWHSRSLTGNKRAERGEKEAYSSKEGVWEIALWEPCDH